MRVVAMAGFLVPVSGASTECARRGRVYTRAVDGNRRTLPYYTILVLSYFISPSVSPSLCDAPPFQ